MEEKKTVKEFINEHKKGIREALIYAAGITIGAATMYVYYRDDIKLANLINKFGPSKQDGKTLLKRVSEYTDKSSCVFWNNTPGYTLETIGKAIEDLRSDATELDYLDAKVNGMLVFTKR